MSVVRRTRRPREPCKLHPGTRLGYVSPLRFDHAGRGLGRTDAAVAKDSWHVGYEDAARSRRRPSRGAGTEPGA